MNYTRIALASGAALVAYFIYGFAMFAAFPAMKTEFLKYPKVYRAKEEMMKMMPFGMVAILGGIVLVAILYAKANPTTSGLASGASFGSLIGLFVVCVFVIHNWVNLNIGAKLTAYQAFAYFLQWVVVGVAIGCVYKPA
jgi:hypothetical protein